MCLYKFGTFSNYFCQFVSILFANLDVFVHLVNLTGQQFHYHATLYTLMHCLSGAALAWVPDTLTVYTLQDESKGGTYFLRVS